MQFDNMLESEKIKTWMALALCGLMILFAANTSSAHDPESVQLDYDLDAGELTVEITHVVADPETHYVERVVVEVDDETVIDEPYTSQPTPDSFDYVYELEAQEGSTIKVTAYCNQAGSTSASIEAGQEEKVDDDTPGFTLVTLFLGISISAAIYYKKRHP